APGVPEHLVDEHLAIVVLQDRAGFRALGNTRVVRLSSQAASRRVWACPAPRPRLAARRCARTRPTPGGRSRAPPRRGARGLARYPLGGYAASSPPRWFPQPSSSPSTCRRRTRLFQYGGPRPGERDGTSVGSPRAARSHAMRLGSSTMASSL